MKKILFICGSMNQTTMMHQISEFMAESKNYFTPYYSDGLIGLLVKTGLLDFSVLGGQFYRNTLNYLSGQGLLIDIGGSSNDYDLVFTCADLIVPKNIRGQKIVLVQEGMTDRKNIFFYLAKIIKPLRFLAGTSVIGLSGMYDCFFVASRGYKEHFIKNGVNASKIYVTGIPNFDNATQYLDNNFPYKNYVLVATSDSRETFKYENRKKFIRKTIEIAAGRQLIFKLHPNEKTERAIKEINKYAPGAIVFSSGNTNHMIANCVVLITRFSSVVYIGLALGKEVYSEFNIDELKKLLPIQNDGSSAELIANEAKELLNKTKKEYNEYSNSYSGKNYVNTACA